MTSEVNKRNFQISPLSLFLALLMTGGCMWAIYTYREELLSSMQLLTHVPPWIWIQLLFLEGLFLLFVATSNQSLYRALGIPTSVSEQYKLVLASGVASRLIPSAGFSGMSAFVWLAYKLGIPVSGSIRVTAISVILVTIQSLPVLLVPLWATSQIVLPNFHIRTAVVISTIVTILFFLVVWLLSTTAFHRFLQHITRRFLKSSRIAFVLEESHQMIRWMLCHPRRWIPALIYLFLLYPVRILMLYTCFVGMGITDAPIQLIVIGYSISLLITGASFLPTTLGIFEISLAGAYHVLGIPLEQATALTLLYRLYTFWLPIPFGLRIWWALRKGRSE